MSIDVEERGQQKIQESPVFENTKTIGDLVSRITDRHEESDLQSQASFDKFKSKRDVQLAILCTQLAHDVPALKDSEYAEIRAYMDNMDPEELEQAIRENPLALSASNEIRDEIKTLKNRIDNSIELPPTRELRLGITEVHEDAKWENWKLKNPEETPLDCLDDVYGHWLKAGLIYQDDIGGVGGLDPDLMKAIRSHMSNHKLKVAQVEGLPPAQKVRNERFFENLPQDTLRKFSSFKKSLSRYLSKKSNK